jgi:hypothetical protein
MAHTTRARAASQALILAGVTALVGVAARAEAAPPSADAAEPRAEVPVLLLMSEDDELGEAVRRAVRIELNDVEVELEAVPMVETTQLRERIEASAALVREREAALGLIWLEPREDGLVIYLVVGDEGMLRRPVVGVEEPRAAVEAAAVIVRHFTTDLLAGRPIGLTRVEEAAVGQQDAGQGEEPGVGQEGAGGPAAPVELPEQTPSDTGRDGGELGAPLRLDERGRLRFSAAYIGQAWAPQRAWDSGAELAIGWRTAHGAHFGARFAIVPRFEDTRAHPTVSGLVSYRVARYPLAFVAGYQHLWPGPRLALDASLAVITEFHQRSALDPIGDLRVEIDGPALRVWPALEPRLRLDYLPLTQLSVFVALGLRVGLVDVAYGLRYEQDGQGVGETVILQPNLVSPVVLVGLGVFL